MKCKPLTILVLVALTAVATNACTSSGQTTGQLPTLAELPTFTPVPTQVPTSAPSNFELTATQVVMLNQTVEAQLAETQTAHLFPTLTPFDFPTLVATSNSSIEAQQWRFSQEVSPFDDTERITLIREADSSIRGTIGNPTPELALRCRAGIFEIFVNTGTQFDIETGHLDRASVRLRFDQETAIDLFLNKSTTGDALFFDKPEEVVQSLISHDTLLFGFTPFGSGFVSTTFNLRGLSEVIQPLLDTCDVQPVRVVLTPTPSACTANELLRVDDWLKELQSFAGSMGTAKSANDVQVIREQFSAMDYPYCIANVREYLLEAIDEAEQMFTATTTTEAQRHRDRGAVLMQQMLDEIDRVIGTTGF